MNIYNFRFLYLLARNLYIKTMATPVKHLSAGSVPVLDIPEGKKFLLYSMRFCPFAQRVHLTMNKKGLSYQVVWVNLASKPEWYVQMCPPGKVPCLKLETGEMMTDSVFISVYLDDIYPPKLVCEDPMKKYRDSLFIDKFNQIGGMFHSIMMASEFNADNMATFLESLKEFENELIKRCGPFFDGAKPGLLDFMIYPWFERFDALPLEFGDKARVDWCALKTLHVWRQKMQMDDAVKSHFLTPEQHAKHFKLRKSNDPGAFDDVI